MSGAQAPAPAAPAAASDNQPAVAAPAEAPDMQPVAAPSDKQPAAAPAKCRGQVLRQWASNGQRSCLIVFPSPVIREDQVGSDAGDAVIVDKGGRVRALWQNRTTLVVEFDVPSAPDVATVSLRPGLRGTKREELVIEPQRFCGEGLYDLVCIKEPGPGQPVFLYTSDGSDERIAMLDRAMGSLRCLSTGKDGHELPVKLRRATRRDVLRYCSRRIATASMRGTRLSLLPGRLMSRCAVSGILSCRRRRRMFVRSSYRASGVRTPRGRATRMLSVWSASAAVPTCF